MATKKPPTPTGNKWNMSRWQVSNSNKGVTLFEALGITKGTIHWPAFKTRIPQQAQSSSSLTGNKTGGGNLSGFKGGGGSPSQNKALGQKMAAAYGWTGAQWTALNNIVMSESGWVTTIHNGGGLGYVSGLAYGIPQALPGTKMASAGKDWKTNPATQIKWMLGYIRSKYGNPEAAWAYHQAHGSY